MSKKLDLTGQRFDSLVVVNKTGEKRNGHVVWRCQCDCGNMCDVIAGHLRSGHTKSCGCYRKEFKVTHGCTKRGNVTTEYKAWSHAKDRCLNQNDRRYKDYGARGITMHPDFINSFELWLAEVGPRPGPEYSIDRIDNDGDYTYGNMRWATAKEQANNTSRNKWFNACNESTNEQIEGNSQTAFAERYGLDSRRISECLNGIRKQTKGWMFRYSKETK